VANDGAPDGPAPDATADHLDMTAMEPPAIRRVRHQLVDQLDAWGFVNGENAALVCSELVTNAVIHAGGAVLITVTRLGPHLRIDVYDHGSAQPRVRTDAGAGGVGLRIVTQLSEQWGSEPTPTGKCVWALLASQNDTQDDQASPTDGPDLAVRWTPRGRRH
jgi:anti-sigma regulatory factor (Ser/Thr protein kinase)